MKETPYLYPPHPLNAPGPFYVANAQCIRCEAPEHEAPDLMSHEVGSHHCYFKKQPETPEELERAIMAVVVGCCESVRYAGRDPEILKRLQSYRSHRDCDVLLQTVAGQWTLPPGSEPFPPRQANPSHPLWDRELDL